MVQGKAAAYMLSATSRSGEFVRRGSAVLALLCLSLVAPRSANADTVQGELSFFGTFATTGGSGPLDLLGGTGIDFMSSFVAQSTGDFSANGVTPFFTPVSLADFTFAPFSPVNPLWTVGVFQFALQNLTSVDQGLNHLALAGNGTLTSTNPGLDATRFNWSFSGNNSGGTLQLFTSTASPIQVAEPSELATLSLLVIGIALLGAWPRQQPVA